MPPKVYGFSASNVRSGGREWNSFHGVIPCSDTKSLITLEHGFQYLQEVQLWLNPTSHHFTSAAQPEVQTQLCIRSKLQHMANQQLVTIHVSFTLWQTSFWMSVLLLSPSSVPPSPLHQDRIPVRKLSRYTPSPLAFYTVTEQTFQCLTNISCWLKSVFKVEDTSKEKCFNSTVWWIFNGTFGICSMLHLYSALKGTKSR